MRKLTTVQNKTIEEFWVNIDDYRKQLKFREWELLTPHNEEAMSVSVKSHKITDTTGNKAIILVKDARYQYLQNVIKAVENTMAKLDDEMNEFVEMRYRSKESSYYEWEDIAYELGVSKAKAFKMRNKLIDMTALELGWV